VFFIFTGQGAQWATMGKELIDHRAFKQSLEISQMTLDVLGCKWRILDELCKNKDTSNIHSPDFSQPICTALQIALVVLLKTWGIQPKSVVGHSSGEIGNNPQLGFFKNGYADLSKPLLMPQEQLHRMMRSKLPIIEESILRTSIIV